MDVTPSGMTRFVSDEQLWKAKEPMVVRLEGKVISVSSDIELKAKASMAVRLVKYCSSLNDVMSSGNSAPSRLVTTAASSMLSSPSPLVSQFCTQTAFTCASAKAMLV